MKLHKGFERCSNDSLYLFWRRTPKVFLPKHVGFELIVLWGLAGRHVFGADALRCWNHQIIDLGEGGPGWFSISHLFTRSSSNFPFVFMESYCIHRYVYIIIFYIFIYTHAAFLLGGVFFLFLSGRGYFPFPWGSSQLVYVVGINPIDFSHLERFPTNRSLGDNIVHNGH